MGAYFRVGIFADEELGSWIARSSRWWGLSTAEFARDPIGLPKGILGPADNLVPWAARHLGMPPTQCLHEHTLVPYLVAGLPIEWEDQIYKSLSAEEKTRLCFVIGKIQLRWCPACVQEDLHRYGTSYWHRLHLLPGVWVCPVHFLRLVPAARYTPRMLTTKRIAGYWLRGEPPHELEGDVLIPTVNPTLLQDISLWSYVALNNPLRFPLKTISLTKNWSRSMEELYSRSFIHSVGCTGIPEANALPQTAAKILLLVAQNMRRRDAERHDDGHLFSL